jgi:hypothetical protein
MWLTINTVAQARDYGWLTHMLPSWQVLKRFSEVILKTKCNLYMLLVGQSHSKQKSISADIVHVHTVWRSYFSLHVKYKLCLYCDMLGILWLRFQDIQNANQLFSCNLHGLHSQKSFHSKIKQWSGNERQHLYKMTCSWFSYPLSHLTQVLCNKTWPNSKHIQLTFIHLAAKIQMT